MKRVGVFGAPGTGRTRLAAELRASPETRHLAVVEEPTASLPDCDVALLMGLDLPSGAGGEAEDARIRALLQAAGVAFQVVYGSGPQRLRSALQALRLAAREEDAASARAWNRVCEKCSDPECEHRLFTRLKQRAGD